MLAGCHKNTKNCKNSQIIRRNALFFNELIVFERRIFMKASFIFALLVVAAAGGYFLALLPTSIAVIVLSYGWLTVGNN